MNLFDGRLMGIKLYDNMAHGYVLKVLNCYLKIMTTWEIRKGQPNQSFISDETSYMEAKVEQGWKPEVAGRRRHVRHMPTGKAKQLWQLVGIVEKDVGKMGLKKITY